MVDGDKIEYVRLAVHSDLPNWVLFTHGTFIIFADVTDEDDLEQQAIDILREHGEVRIGESSADFQVTTLSTTVGWVVRGNVPGLYVYVHPTELDSDDPDDLEVGLFARVIRQTDFEDLEVLHVNRG
ncbi:MAG TPA: hypothetical protein VK203_20365 [Nostocaceae cyanobacterium]|nr:hypothetical protein [Nostocaceae cyanobacterium]